MNVDHEGHLLINGEVQPLHKATQTIKHQADLVKLNLKVGGVKLDATGGLPTTIILRRQRDVIRFLKQPDQSLPVQRLPQVRAQGDDGHLGFQSDFFSRARSRPSLQ